MKTSKLLLSIALGGILMSAPACVKRVDNSEKTRAEYEKTLTDSINKIKVEIDSCNDCIATLRDKVGERMHDFTTVANPKEVGSYTIFTSFKSKYPQHSTGLVARIDENGKFELVATLKGKAFQQIAVKAPSETLESAVVPHDQALNYRTSELTSVLFSGEKADSIGRLIADNELNPLTVIYMQGGPVSANNLTNAEAEMISQTWLLYNDMDQLHKLERRVPMLHERINLLRQHQR